MIPKAQHDPQTRPPKKPWSENGLIANWDFEIKKAILKVNGEDVKHDHLHQITPGKDSSKVKAIFAHQGQMYEATVALVWWSLVTASASTSPRGVFRKIIPKDKACKTINGVPLASISQIRIHSSPRQIRIHEC